MRPKQVSDLRVKIFADGADKAGMLKLYANPLIKGFTTNPTLMRKAGISDYRSLRPRPVEGDPRSADLLRGLLRRVRGNGAAGAGDRHVGDQRLREDSHHQHARRFVRAVGPRSGRRRHQS